ncbi:MAG: lysophospholipid acyltransferase family protein [Acidobacteria bacterium]|nr:lysophospholipid acyltransferase family protein [Acidobacteriota bacterium]
MGKHGKVQTALEYAAARTLLTGLSLAPRAVAVAAGRGLGRIAYTFGGRLRRAGTRNLEMAFPDLSATERERLLRGCFANLGRLLGEFSHFEKASPESLARLVECEGLEHLEAAEARGKGTILFTGHLGAWELTSLALSAFGHRVDFLARRIDNPLIEELVERTRTRFGNRSIDKRAAARPMLRTLSSGGTLGILVDLNTQPHEGVFVDFFGIPASTTSSLATLALRTDAAVLPVFAPWDEERGRFLLHIEPPVDITRSDDPEEDVRALTARITQVIEKYVRRYPEQWLWIHKRWNTRPHGEADLYAARTKIVGAGLVPARIARQDDR